ncbi:GIY-YIG nuclease family protein [uncultured Methanobrevibacter sp.]|uniref:GIY-YIG nuclease family protein n=1 Tax=uncultured Methanobrevibacter sp. TaxID=253161 RepID=UPI0025D9B75B|nr:GIY-YIG nuclease family protein [uncultured Methanobrevibacter sp.]
MTSGIYKLTNCSTGKSYIGQSKNIEKRINEHITDLDNGSHHNRYLQEDWQYYDFEWAFIEETRPNRDILNKREIFWISYFDTKRNGYNETCGGDFYEESDSKIGNDKWKLCSNVVKELMVLQKVVHIVTVHHFLNIMSQCLSKRVKVNGKSAWSVIKKLIRLLRVVFIAITHHFINIKNLSNT